MVLTSDDGVLHGVFTDIERAFDYDTNDIGWFRFAASERLIVTARLHPLRCVEAARLAVDRGLAIHGAVGVFAAVVTEFEKVLDALVVEMSDELDRIEDYVFETAPRDERRRLGPVRRTVVRLNRQLRASVALFRRYQRWDEHDPLPTGTVEMSETLADLLGSVLQEMQGLQDRARLLHEEIDSKISSETNRHLYILSIMTAFLLPPTLVTGFFGMNTGGLPFAGEHFGTLLAVCSGRAVGVGRLVVPEEGRHPLKQSGRPEGRPAECAGRGRRHSAAWDSRRRGKAMPFSSKMQPLGRRRHRQRRALDDVDIAVELDGDRLG